MTAAELAKQIGGRRSGQNWVACCPAHPDRNPSLSINESGGVVLVHCHAGCRQVDVIEALRARGLWEPDQRAPEPKRPRIVAEYNYTDERGKLLYQIVRQEPKTFLQRYPNDRGGWIWRKHPRQVLYHLPEVLEAAIVFIVEGERDAETLREHGFVATTNAGGAKASWLPAYTEALRGLEVILIPDNDPPGRERVLRIAKALLGKAVKIIIIELEGAKDITAWFEAGHSEIELIAEVEGHGVNH